MFLHCITFCLHLYLKKNKTQRIQFVFTFVLHREIAGKSRVLVVSDKFDRRRWCGSLRGWGLSRLISNLWEVFTCFCIAVVLQDDLCFLHLSWNPLLISVAPTVGKKRRCDPRQSWVGKCPVGGSRRASRPNPILANPSTGRQGHHHQPWETHPFLASVWTQS